MRLSELANRLGVSHVGDDVLCERLEVDSRKVTAGDVFVATHGEHVDGHQFIADAVAQGAVACIVDRTDVAVSVPHIVVKDTTQSLIDAAGQLRADFSGKVIAITGSVGKTTVRRLTTHLLNQYGSAYSVTASHNTPIGISLDVLMMPHGMDWLVVEFATNSPGEIAELSQWMKPDIGVITMVKPVHLEGLGSLEGVAQEKSQIIRHLSPEGTAVFPVDTVWSAEWASDTQAKVVTFGASDATVAVQDITIQQGSSHGVMTMNGQDYPVMLPVLAPHWLYNAQIAVAIATALGLPTGDLMHCWSDFVSEPGRMHWQASAVCRGVIDDTYNANPTSMRAAIDVLSTLDGPRVLVMGDMGELGDDAKAIHVAMGEYARDRVDVLYACGPLSAHAAQAFGLDAQAFDEPQALIDALLAAVQADWSLLVKGSRFMRMEQVCAAVVQANSKGTV